MKIIGLLCLCLLGFLVLLLLAAILRTLCMQRKRADYAPAPDPTRTDAYSRKLSTMIQFETISHRDDPELAKFRGFHGVLETLFPNVHRVCEKIDLEGSLLFRFPGRPGHAPILLMSHMDVVEASGDWRFAPFSGQIAEGKLWGRGTGDTKGSLFAFFQAVEEMIVAGETPPCDIYLASSCTEEIGGQGAPRIVSYLRAQGIHLAMLCDEGGGIIRDPMPGISGAFAMLGVFEKGTGDLRFIAHGKGGHASAPGRNTPIPRLAQFITRVEQHHPFRAAFLPEVKVLFTRLAPYAGFGMRLLFGNFWLFAPLLLRVMPRISAQAAAMLRTTIAFTMQQGSAGCNVLPQEAWVSANLRFIPHQGTQESLRVVTALAARYGLETEVLSAGEPSASVDIHGRAFRMAETAIAQCFPGVASTPYVVTGATDARFYADICDQCIRFAPLLYSPEALRSMHGINEHIACDALPGAVDFYKAVIRMADMA